MKVNEQYHYYVIHLALRIEIIIIVIPCNFIYVLHWRSKLLNDLFNNF